MVTVVQPVDLSVLGDQYLWNQIDTALVTLAVHQDLRDLIVELACMLNVAYGQQAQPITAPQPHSATVTGTLAGSKVKLEAPERFDSNAQKLSNCIFQVRTYAEVLGIPDATEQVKLAITLLTGRALTWWRILSQEGWAILGYCDWATFEAKLAEQFRDLHQVMRMRRELAKLRQTASVQAYNAAFRNVYMEIRTEMSDADALFTYISGQKEIVQMQVMLQDPADLLQAMSLADRTDSTTWFAGHHQGPQQPGRHPQPPRPPHQGIRTGYPRPRAGGRPSNPVPMDLGFQRG